MLTATPTGAHCAFVIWSDSIVDNPRRLKVLQDTAMEAVLVGGIGVGEVTGPSVSIAPNPARQRFMVTISEAIIELAVNGIKGRTVCTLSPVGHTMVVDVLTLPPSLCFVTVTTDLGIAR